MPDAPGASSTCWLAGARSSFPAGNRVPSSWDIAGIHGSRIISHSHIIRIPLQWSTALQTLPMVIWQRRRRLHRLQVKDIRLGGTKQSE